MLEGLVLNYNSTNMHDSFHYLLLSYILGKQVNGLSSNACGYILVF